MAYKYLLPAIFMFLIAACSNERCEETITGAYAYPIEAAAGKTFEEHIEMYKIPAQTLHCMSTGALVESCLNYPEMRLIWTRNSLQEGFDDVKTWCNGYGELFNRKDRFKGINIVYKQINFSREWTNYTNLENGRFMDSVVRIELVISQYEILKGIAQAEKKEFVQQLRENYSKKAEQVQRWGTTGVGTNCAILARMMYHDKYPPMMVEINKNPAMLSFINKISPAEILVINKVIVLAESYYNSLK